MIDISIYGVVPLARRACNSTNIQYILYQSTNNNKNKEHEINKKQIYTNRKTHNSIGTKEHNQIQNEEQITRRERDKGTNKT